MPNETPKRYGDFALYGRLWGEAHPYRGHLGGLFFLSLLAAPLALLLPLPVKVVVDAVIKGEALAPHGFSVVHITMVRPSWRRRMSIGAALGILKA